MISNLYSIFVQDTIRLIISVDGLPLSKSSGSFFWPILGYLRQRYQFVFPIGIYWGNKKPDNSNKFIKFFVDKIKQLISNGINVKQYTDNNTLINVYKNITIDAFCFEQPTKSFILHTKFHSGFYSCTTASVNSWHVFLHLSSIDDTSWFIKLFSFSLMVHKAKILNTGIIKLKIEIINIQSKIYFLVVSQPIS
ncbi:hypothetical protein AGLY_010666 [Aphis glycines]|uniref:Uncharacterized protein n=1 Tax=Aphis glycines TaxID=307491 RepID=A0A6G0TFI6_APHGL|nr:hypothetical protein AGLY_010666 [Aphis glycines]